VVLATSDRRRRPLLLLHQLARDGGGGQRQGVERGAGAVRGLRARVHGLGPVPPRRVGAVAELAAAYAAGIAPPAAAGADGLIDAWVLDVDDTCLSNQPYYQVKQFGYVSIVRTTSRVESTTPACQ
jgi:hypothetical protein